MDRTNLIGCENIKCVAVFADLDSASATMRKALREGRYIIVPASGHIGHEENSFAVVNISSNMVKLYSARYRQPSYVFADLTEDTVNAYVDEDGNLTLEGDDYKCQIPMNVLADYNERIAWNYRIAESEQYIHFKTLDDCIRFSIERVGMTPMIIRNLLNRCVPIVTK
ncbi:MAG: hypothetical protein IKB00_01460 [Bacteroidaceae bacterium]|nr:hypothetical protein [Bacteroidaceae bacterium]